MSLPAPVIEPRRRGRKPAAIPRPAVVSFSELPDVLSVAQAAKALGLCERTVRRGVQRGDIQAIRVGQAIKIPKAWILRHPSAPQPEPQVDRTAEIQEAAAIQGRAFAEAFAEELIPALIRAARKALD